MADFRTYFDNDFLADWDLGGQDVTLTITRVACGIVTNKDGSAKKILVDFAEVPKKWICNKTNARIVAGMYGVDTSAWLGKRITIFPTTTEMEGQIKPCIRVRPGIPSDVTGPGTGLPLSRPLMPAGAPPPIEAQVAGRGAPAEVKKKFKKQQREEARRG